MLPRNRFHLLAMITLAVLFAAGSARAVIIAGTTATDNRTAPAGNSLWYNVGYLPYGSWDSGGSGIYLGNRWVLTAGHAHGGSTTAFPFVFPEINHTFNAVIGEWHAAPGGADLTLFRLSEDPALYSSSLSQNVFFGKTPSVGTSVTMIGAGRNRESTLKKWNLSIPSQPENSTWTETPGAGHRSGYLYDDTLGSRFAKRWGSNVTASIWDGTANQTTIVANNTVLTSTAFSSGAGASEGQAASGDSGGAIIANNRLVGMMLYTGDWVNNAILGQPAYPDPTYINGTPYYFSRSAVFGNTTYSANLFSYVDWIAEKSKTQPSWAGDANLDGLVDNQDFALLYSNFGSGTKWSQGDFNLDGKVDFKDYQILQINFGKSDASPASPELAPVFSSVPEPGMGLVAIGALALLVRRRSR